LAVVDTVMLLTLRRKYSTTLRQFTTWTCMAVSLRRPCVKACVPGTWLFNTGLPLTSTRECLSRLLLSGFTFSIIFSS